MYLRLKIIILLTLSFSAMAQNEVVSLLESAQSTARDPMACEDNPFNTCALELCGSPESNPFYGRTSYRGGVGGVSELPATIRERLTNLVRAQSSEAQKILGRLRSQSQTPAPLTTDAEWEAEAKNLFGSFVQFEIDTTLPQDSRVTRTLTPPTGATPEFMQGLESYAQGYVELLTANPRFGIAEGFYSEEESSALLALDSKSNPANSLTLCRNEICRESLQRSRTERAAQRLRLFEAAIQSLPPETDRLASCMDNYAQSFDSDAQVEEIRARVPIETENIINNAMTGSSAHSKEAFRAHVQNNVVLNLRPEETLRQSEENLSSKPASRSTKDIDRIVDSIIGSETPDFNSLIEACKSSQTRLIEKNSDSANYGLGRPTIELSHFSCTHLDYGTQILSHELGHILSFALAQNLLSRSSKVEFNRIRSCVTGRNSVTPIPRQRLQHSGDQRFSEEDMADLTASLANPNGRLASCAFLRPSMDGSRYEDLTLVNPDATDEHSSNFARVLREVQDKRRSLPASCQRVVEQNPDTINLRQCQ